MRIILGSESPRRVEIMGLLGLKFDCVSPNVDETVDEVLMPHELVTHLSRRKAEAVWRDCGVGDILITADTVVAMDNLIFGKPSNEIDARIMLEILSGGVHSVFTGVTITSGGENPVFDTFYEETRVTFAKMSDNEIDEYIESGEPFGKAGAYAIQGRAGRFVTRIEGDYYNVVGLPLSAVYQKIKSLLHGYCG